MLGYIWGMLGYVGVCVGYVRVCMGLLKNHGVTTAWVERGGGADFFLILKLKFLSSFL